MKTTKVIEHANCGDSGNVVSGSAILKGTTYLYSPSTLSGSFIMDVDSANGGTGDHGVHFGWAWGQDPARLTGLTNNLYIYAQYTFERDNPVFAMDRYGINHGFLMNGCRAARDITTPARGGLVLPLDGVSQYVELHNSLNDFKETTICVWVNWSGSGEDQRIWSMGDGAGREMYLTPRDATTGRLRFSIAQGATLQSLEGSAPLAAHTWIHLAVVFSESGTSRG